MFFIFLVLMFSEADTRSKFTDPKLYAQGWKEEYIVREWSFWCLDLSELWWGDEDKKWKSWASVRTILDEKIWKSERKSFFRVSLSILSEAWKYGTRAVQDGGTDQALWPWSDQYCGFYEGFCWAGGIDAGMEGLADGVI